MELLLDAISVSPHAVLDGAGPDASDVLGSTYLALLDSLKGLLLLHEVLCLIHSYHFINFSTLVLDLIKGAPVSLRHLVALFVYNLLLSLPHLSELNSIHLFSHGYVFPSLT